MTIATQALSDKTAIIDDWPFPVLLLDPVSHETVWANHVAQEWFGRSLRKLIGLVPDDVIQTDVAIAKMIDRSMNINAAVTQHDTVIFKNRTDKIRCDLTCFPTGDWVGLALHFTGNKPQVFRSEEPVVSGLGRLIAHELKNPLAGIKGAAQLLSDEVTSAEGRTLIDLITSEIDRIRRLADRMETLGDHDPDNLELVNIHEILRRARRVIQSANPDLIFTERYDPSIPNVKGDGDTLMQAILNIIKNASEAIQGVEGGEIILETGFRAGVSRRPQDPSDGLGHLPIEVRIIDNGPGIEDRLREQVFQPFVTTKPGGQGLGLALVAKVAAAHGGVVEIQSNPGQTILSILLPIYQG